MTKARRKRGRKRRPRSILSPAEQLKRRYERRFRNNIRTLFVGAGFTYVQTRDMEIEVVGRASDIDGLFLFENVIVIVEDTTLTSSSVGDHLRKKAEFYRHLAAHKGDLIGELETKFAEVRTYFRKHAHYAKARYAIKFVYCSCYGADEAHIKRYASDCRFLNAAHLQYFVGLTRTIRRSARFEIFKCLDLELDEIGPVKSASDATTYSALLLSEIPSGFPADHKLVSFLVDPASLLERVYVLRTDSWRDQDALYQRLLVRGKIGSMREYLVTEGRVFVNNIIVTLPEDTVFRNAAGATLRDRACAIAPVMLTLPRRFNSIGIIDGQHRVFAYHEGNDRFEKRIAPLRAEQHLLVTGIVYPESVRMSQAREFEAKLFLEINDKQKRVRGDLKQAIEQIVHPFSAIAIAKAVIERMAATGPLSGVLGVHFYDAGKLRTASIVSYGLRHLTAIGAEVSLFNEWHGAGKAAVKRGTNKEALASYVNYCATQLNMMFAGFRDAVPAEMWTSNLKESRVLTTTTINGVVFCLRRLLERRRVPSDYKTYRAAFGRMTVRFDPEGFRFKSSHWRNLGDELYAQCFS